MAPSGKPHQGPTLRPFGLPQLSIPTPTAESHHDTPTSPGTPIRYQRVFHLTPANLAPYAELTFPSLAPGSTAITRINGELLGLSAMASGVMVGLAIASVRRWISPAALPQGGCELAASRHRHRLTAEADDVSGERGHHAPHPQLQG